MSEHFDAVIAGTGFGGSVMAYRLAEAGLRVCVIERGKAYPPGSFPRAPHEMKRNFWDPSEGLYGLFNLWSFPGAGALISSALGGGSHIYANVMIRKDERWFDGWPVTRSDLEPHYDEVETRLGVQKYPFEASTAKTLAMKGAAAQLGLDWHLPNLAVNFGNPPAIGAPIVEAHPNLHGAARSTCRLCGECDVGCNYGSKNTLDFNYLSDAQRYGADIRTLCELHRFEKKAAGEFEIDYVRHNPERTSASAPSVTITADRLILAAGTFGTTYLLFKNRAAFPRLSPMLGRRYSGNGDLLSFILNTRKPTNPTFGPVITSAIRRDDFYVEDGGYPVFLAWLVESAFDPVGFLRRAGDFTKRTVYGAFGLDPDTDLGREFSDLLGPCATAQHSLPILSMGLDTPSGTMSLNGKYLNCDWTIDKSSAYYKRLAATGREIAHALGGHYVDNPAFDHFRQVLTAHPLGGCAMGKNRDEGVVDSFGEVFEYPNLYVTDGAMLPGPVGPNPALTIAALADRAATHILGGRH